METGGVPTRHHRPSRPGAHYARHDFDGAGALTTTLVHAISDATGVDTTDAEFRLVDHVDPEALDRLFEPAGDTPRLTGHLSFAVWGYQVTVYSDGGIVITPPQNVSGHVPRR